MGKVVKTDTVDSVDILNVSILTALHLLIVAQKSSLSNWAPRVGCRSGTATARLDCMLLFVQNSQPNKKNPQRERDQTKRTQRERKRETKQKKNLRRDRNHTRQIQRMRESCYRSTCGPWEATLLNSKYIKIYWMKTLPTLTAKTANNFSSLMFCCRELISLGAWSSSHLRTWGPSSTSDDVLA